MTELDYLREILAMQQQIFLAMKVGFLAIAGLLFFINLGMVLKK